MRGGLLPPVLALVLAPILASVLAPPGASAASLTNAVEAERPPFTYLAPSGRPAGFDVEILDWIAREMELTVTREVVAPGTALAAVRDGKADTACAGQMVTPEALEEVDFTRPYAIIRHVFVAGEGGGMTRARVLRGKTLLGVQRATGHAEWLAAERDKGEADFILQYYDSIPQIFDDLLAGAIDAAAMETEHAEKAINADGRPVVIVGDFGPSFFYAIAVRKGDGALKDLLDEGIRRLKRDPFWEELNRKYFGVAPISGFIP